MILLFASVLVVVTSAQAQEPIPLYEFRQDEVPVIDGSLDDWVSLLAEPTVTTSDFANFRSNETAVASDDLRMQAYMGWVADGRVLVGARRIDDVYRDDFEGGEPNLLGLDNILFGVDADASGGRIHGSDGFIDCEGPLEDVVRREDWECVSRLYYSHRQGQRFDIAVAAGNVVSTWLDFRDWATKRPFIEVAGTIRKVGPVTEVITEFQTIVFDTLDFRGPDESNRSTLVPGKIIALDLGFADDDNDGTKPYDDYFATSGKTKSNSTDEWRKFILVEAADRPTSLSPKSWAQMKNQPR